KIFLARLKTDVYLMGCCDTSQAKKQDKTERQWAVTRESRRSAGGHQGAFKRCFARHTRQQIADAPLLRAPKKSRLNENRTRLDRLTSPPSVSPTTPRSVVGINDHDGGRHRK